MLKIIIIIIIYKAAEHAKNESSGSTTMTTFEFLQRLLVRFSVLVPIDLNVEKAEFGGKEYGMVVHANAQRGELRHTPMALPEKPSFFFLFFFYRPSSGQENPLVAQGQHGNGGRSIRQGGFEIVTKAIERVVREYGSLEFEKEGVCPDCLADIKVTDAGVWNWTQVIQASRIGGAMPRCKEGHSIDYRLVGGLLNKSCIRADSLGRIRH